MIPILTKEQLEEEKKRSENLGWPYLPAVYKIPPKRRYKVNIEIKSRKKAEPRIVE